MMRTYPVLLPSVVVGAVLSLFFATAVFAANPSVSIVAPSSTPLSTISVSGANFAPNETVMLSLGLSSATAHADATGAFSGVSLTIPSVPSGLYYVIAVGQNSGMVGFNSLWVSSFFANANPSGWYLAPGQMLSWSGSGFAPNETISIKDASNTQIASFNADSSGNFTAMGATQVPYSARNSTVQYTVSGTSSGTNLHYTLAVGDLYPYANPSSWYALPGTPVTFSGSGFANSEVVNLLLGSSTAVLGSATANSSGSFTLLGPVTLPFGSSANYRLVGQSSGATALVPVTLASFYPTLTPSAYYSAPGSSITLGGSGFAPNEDVTIKVDATTKGTAHTNGTGSFSGFALQLPATPNTMPVVSGVGAQSGATASFAMAVGSYYSWLNLSTWWAQGGSALTLFGHNFAGGETVTATAGAQTLGSIVANSSGDATIVSTVPFVVPGPATITLTGGTSGATASATMTVAQVWTDLQLESYGVTVGQPIHFIGHGYLANEGVEITTNKTTGVQATLTTNATGDLDATWTLPTSVPEGELVITAKSLHSFDTKSITIWAAH